MYDTGLGAAQTWQERCRAAGGIPTAMPPGKGPRDMIGQEYAGYPACRIGPATGPFTYYDPLTSSESSAWKAQVNADDRAILAGKIVTPIVDGAAALGLDNGLTGFGAKILGIPKWLFVTVIALAGYSYGVKAGVLPSFHEIKGKKG